MTAQPRCLPADLPLTEGLRVRYLHLTVVCGPLTPEFFCKGKSSHAPRVCRAKRRNW